MGQEVQSRLCVVASTAVEIGQLAAILDAANAATLLITGGGDGTPTAAAAHPLVELAQSKGIAALIVGDAQLARTLRADGVHLPWSRDIVERYGEARDILGTRYIVGVDVGRSRHDAMGLAEAGADYIGFGIPPHVEDRAAAADRRVELVAWWGEIFEVPCIALDVESTEEAVALAGVGADFIALRGDLELPAADYTTLAHNVGEAARQREALA